MAPSKRIVFVAPFGMGKKATVGSRTLPLARNLVHLGHRVSLLIPPWDTPADAGRSWDDRGVEVVHVRLGAGPLAVAFRLVREIDARAPDIVHIVKPRAYAGVVQEWLWMRRGVRRDGPCIVLDVDDWEQAWAPVNGYHPLLARGLAWQEEWGIRHADAITAASRWLEQRAQRYAPATPRLYLPNGVDPAAAEARSNPVVQASDSGTAAGVLFFTRYVEVAPAWLADFWTKLHARAPNARLLVVGEAVQPEIGASYRSRVTSLVESAAGAIEWLGFMPPSAMPAIYARTRCAIFPAENSILMQAKCSAKLAGTLLAGVPTVASNVGEQVNYAAGGAARLVRAEATPHEFAEEVAHVLADSDTRQALAEQARSRLASVYAWPRLAAELSAFYAQACTPRRPFNARRSDC